MRDLAEYIIKQLVNNPDAVSVEESSNEGEVELLVSVDPTDMGIVIGKSGQTIKAIRRLLTVRAITENVRVNLRLNEPVGEGDGGDEGKKEGVISTLSEVEGEKPSLPAGRSEDESGDLSLAEPVLDGGVEVEGDEDTEKKEDSENPKV